MTLLLNFVQFPFMPVALAAQIALGVAGPPEDRRNEARIHFQAPANGSWVVARSCDLMRWEFAGSGYARSACNVTVRVPADGRCEFYAVGFVSH